ASALGRGVEVTVHFDEKKFAGSGLFLFASVLERFLALYCTVNSFSKLVATVEGKKGELRRWPPRMGEKVLLSATTWSGSRTALFSSRRCGGGNAGCATAGRGRRAGRPCRSAGTCRPTRSSCVSGRCPPWPFRLARSAKFASPLRPPRLARCLWK